MDILKSILKIIPDWQGTVWGNSYEGIKPDVSETRPIPSLAELETAWVEIEAEELKAKTNAGIFAKLEEIDKKSVRALRDGDTIYIENYRAEAEAERKKILK